MSRFRSERIARFLQTSGPFKKFGEFALLPIFFVSGAALEYVMINWHVGEVNFYRTFKRRQAQERAKQIVDDYLKQRNNSQ
ncbi:small integral membrane protein 4 [Thrips palmi]|uniref:Small integral membrane protein 4 n=1 Tax=Thrips palmi TaxID=161013 RepID=A0A6P9A603_THRPL|nr:small integral membrane protein 4 [Thrips palmi]